MMNCIFRAPYRVYYMGWGRQTFWGIPASVDCADMQYRLTFWFSCDSSCLRPHPESLSLFGCTLIYDLRNALSYMWTMLLCLCQLLKDITIYFIFSECSVIVWQGPCERQDVWEWFMNTPQWCLCWEKEWAVATASAEWGSVSKNRVHSILIKFTCL